MARVEASMARSDAQKAEVRRDMVINIAEARRARESGAFALCIPSARALPRQSAVQSWTALDALVWPQLRGAGVQTIQANSSTPAKVISELTATTGSMPALPCSSR